MQLLFKHLQPIRHRGLPNAYWFAKQSMSTTTTPQKYMLFKNGIKQTFDKPGSVFLKEYPRGGYSVMRTVKQGKCILQYPIHVQRLANSCKLMLLEEAKEIPSELQILTDEKKLGKKVMKLIHTSINAYGNHENKELRIVVHITWNMRTKGFDIYTHVEPLPELHADGVQVEIIPGSRAHVEAKDSEWVRYKTNILKMANPSSNEVLLVDKNSNIYEGLSSNFFVVKDSTIYTAGEGIIYGTIRNIVLEACKELNLKVVLQTPKLNEINEWKEAFLTSTSRLVLPIHTLIVHETEKYFEFMKDKQNNQGEVSHDTKKVYNLKESSVSSKLLDAVVKKLEAKSTPISDVN